MAETRREERARRFLSLAAGRLAENRWMFAAGAAAVLAVAFAAGVPATIAVGAILFLFVAALFAPRRTRSQRQADRAAGGGRRRA